MHDFHPRVAHRTCIRGSRCGLAAETVSAVVQVQRVIVVLHVITVGLQDPEFGH